MQASPLVAASAPPSPPPPPSPTPKPTPLSPLRPAARCLLTKPPY